LFADEDKKDDKSHHSEEEHGSFHGDAALAKIHVE